MDILKLSKYGLFFLLISCFSEVDKEKCNTYINEGNAVKVSFIKFKNLEVDSIKCFVQKKSVQKMNISLGGGNKTNAGFFIHEQILLTDTIQIEYKEQKYQIYNFQNHIIKAIYKDTRQKEDYCELNSYRINYNYKEGVQGGVIINGSKNY